MSVELTNSELEEYLYLIFTGEKLIKVNNEYLVLKQPDNKAKIKANYIRKEAYDQAVKEGFLPRAKLEELIEERGLFTEADKAKINKLESKLEGQRVLLAKTTKVKANQDRLRKIISDIEEEIFQVKSKKLQKLMMSADTKADEYLYDYLCWYCTYKENDERFWPTFDAFNIERNLVVRERVLSEFILFYNGISTEVIRSIARNNIWRIRYITSGKTSDPLFNRPTTEYTSDMLNLVFWSNYYNNIYEMLPEDRPPDSIIDDDEALDAYMNNYYDERSKETAARRYKRNSGGKLSAFDQEEVIVTQSNPLYEDIEYDKPREAQRIKEKTAVRKKAKHGRRR